ncbi:MAG TPA: ABC transporter ATP-binding protein [Casimicrobiaceae bacterium]|nr:ABC transporter ATP-binding protein [Casimicrobiaceae bacterium]
MEASAARRAADAETRAGRAKIIIDDLTLDYTNLDTGASHRAVEHLDLVIAADEFLCVLGPSGCGKSTLLSAIAGFLKPAQGTIAMDGKPIEGPGAERGVVFQEYALLPWMNVLDNAALGLKLRGVPRKERYERARQFLALANLHGVEHKYPHELSGGMKQRVAVARTLANAPEVMLMDEPFAAVDAQTRMVLQEELCRISLRSRLTVIFITHAVEEAIFLGDRIAVMSPGPGRIRTIVDVPFARDARTWSRLNADPVFGAMRDDLLALVRGASPAQAAEARA